jgi:serine/threonine protein phosphatase 1
MSLCLPRSGGILPLHPSIRQDSVFEYFAPPFPPAASRSDPRLFLISAAAKSRLEASDESSYKTGSSLFPRLPISISSVEESSPLAYDTVMACYVIGDIHGCSDEVACLIEHLPLAASDRVVFLGDYVDRGPDSKGVISYLLRFVEQNKHEVVFLKGNHEDMFLAYLGLPGQYGDMFLYNGGGATLASYGIANIPARGDAILPLLPEAHLEFLRNLQPYYLADPFLCVHAGVHPLKSLQEQTETEMLWIRQEFISNRHRLPYTVIFGHTPQREILLDLPYKIGIDTGLVYGNKLSCIELDEKILFQIERKSRKVKRTLIKQNWGPPSLAQNP